MDAGKHFSIGFRTCNTAKETGGEFIHIPEAVKHNYKTATDRLRATEHKEPLRKNPNHYENSTRNIRVIATGNIIKVHLRLITQFNNKAVL